MARLPPCKDVILADACDRVGVAPQFDAVEFYENARRCLSRGGVFVANMCGDLYDRAAHFLTTSRELTTSRVFSMGVPLHLVIASSVAERGETTSLPA